MPNDATGVGACAAVAVDAVRRSRLWPTLTPIAVAFTAAVVMLSIAHAPRLPPPPQVADSGSITATAFADGLSACQGNALAAAVNPLDYATGGPPASHKDRRNPRFEFLLSTPVARGGNGGRPVLIRNATVWDGVGNVLHGTDVLLCYGIIARIANDLTLSSALAAVEAVASRSKADLPRYREEDIEVVDAGGRVVSPGLVDQHSHVGIGSLPTLVGNDDGNEKTMLNPQLRTIDTINVLDPAFDIVLSGGVTTSLILPGSEMLMGGEAFGIKLMAPLTHAPEDFGVNRGMDDSDGRAWRWMKMACGENPKDVGRSKRMMPTSRMGSGWLLRRQLEAARDFMQRQEDWCEAAHSAMAAYGDTAHVHLASRYPDDLDHEALAALLRGDMRFQIHCYKTQDLEMMVRNSHEFGYNITTFHHATEAHLVAPLLARENISAAIFADVSLHKEEGYEHTVRAGQVLHAAGARFAFKSDHPVLNAQNLLFEAQKAVHYGMDPALAFMAVTSVPAERLGLGWRVGRIAEAYDADIVVWDRPPFDLGASPLRVYVDGFEALSKPTEPVSSDSFQPVPPVSPVLEAPVEFTSYTVANASCIIAGPDHLTSGAVVVRDGVVTCVGPTCAEEGAVFDAQGGVLMPGMVAANSYLGLGEIMKETSTTDGRVDSGNVLEGVAHAADGLRVGDDFRTLQYAFRHGVLTAISPPLQAGFLSGVSVAFRTGAKSYDEAIIKRDVAMHVTIGTPGKEPGADSVTVQLGRLRQLLSNASTTAAAAGSAEFAAVQRGDLPLVVNVHDASDISKLLKLVSTQAPATPTKLLAKKGRHSRACAFPVRSTSWCAQRQPLLAMATVWTRLRSGPSCEHDSQASELLNAAVRTARAERDAGDGSAAPGGMGREWSAFVGLATELARAEGHPAGRRIQALAESLGRLARRRPNIKRLKQTNRRALSTIIKRDGKVDHDTIERLLEEVRNMKKKSEALANA
ncbi:hypothetical protein HK405_015238 [Cladochytrium tenue]|nr:hypothetical protein HK405_015238 [Cladochytrium tenue]